MVTADVRSELQRIIAEKRRILVVGLGISGIETAKFLVRCGINVVTIESTDEERYSKSSKFGNSLKELRDLGVECRFGVDGEGAATFLDAVDLAVLSPGVSLESAMCGTLKRHNIPFISELELGLELYRLPSVIVTGSNGKSTTVTLIHELLKSAGFESKLCGNVGIPVVADLTREHVCSAPAPSKKVLVVEASSYQLETCRSVRPKVAVLLNISDNHLERHGTLQRYFDAKSRLFANQDRTDFAVLNCDDPIVFSLAERLAGQVVAFGRAFVPGATNCGAAIGDTRVIARRVSGQDES